MLSGYKNSPEKYLEGPAKLSKSSGIWGEQHNGKPELGEYLKGPVQLVCGSSAS